MPALLRNRRPHKGTSTPRSVAGAACSITCKCLGRCFHVAKASECSKRCLRCGPPLWTRTWRASVDGLLDWSKTDSKHRGEHSLEKQCEMKCAVLEPLTVTHPFDSWHEKSINEAIPRGLQVRGIDAQVLSITNTALT